MLCTWQLANKMAYVNGGGSGYTVLCCDCSVACPLVLSSLKTENPFPIAIHQTSDFKLQTMPETRQAALAKRNLKTERMKDLIGIGIMGHWTQQSFKHDKIKTTKLNSRGHLTSLITVYDSLTRLSPLILLGHHNFKCSNLKSQDSR